MCRSTTFLQASCRLSVIVLCRHGAALHIPGHRHVAAVLSLWTRVKSETADPARLAPFVYHLKAKRWTVCSRSCFLRSSASISAVHVPARPASGTMKRAAAFGAIGTGRIDHENHPLGGPGGAGGRPGGDCACACGSGEPRHKRRQRAHLLARRLPAPTMAGTSGGKSSAGNHEMRRERRDVRECEIVTHRYWRNGRRVVERVRDCD